MTLLAACRRGRTTALDEGLRALRRGNLDRAIAHLTRALEDNPTNASAHCNLGLAYLKKQQTNEALLCFRQAAALEQTDPRPLGFLAQVYIGQGRWHEAAEALAEAQRRAPRSPSVLTALAVVHWQTQGPAAAFHLLTRALEVAPNYPPALYNMAMLQRDAYQDPATARAYFLRYLKVCGGDPRAAAVRRMLKEAPRQTLASPPSPAPTSAAVAAGTPTHDRSPSPAPKPKVGERAQQTALDAYNQGIRHHAAREWTQAARAYERALTANPNLANAAYNLGLVRRAAGNLTGARAAFEQALAVNPEMAKARYMLAMVQHELKDDEAALSELQRLVREQPRNAEAHLLMGVIYGQNARQTALARSAYQRYLELAPNGPSAAQVRAWLQQHR